MAITRKAQAASLIKKSIQFLHNLSRNKRGAFGVAILVIAVATAVFAPLLAHNDPVNDTYVAGDLAMPLWMKSLPGGQHLSENSNLMAKPGLSTIESLQEWNFATTQSTGSSSPTLGYSPSIGRKTPGSAVITFEREKNGEVGEVGANLTKEFYFPYTGPPRRFTCSVEVAIEGTGDPMAGGYVYLDVPIEILVFIKQAGGNRIDLWRSMRSAYSEGGPIRFYNQNATYWVLGEGKSNWEGRQVLDSYASKLWVELVFGEMFVDPARVIFTEPSNYTYGVEVLFTDNKPGKTVRSTVYISDLDVRLYGSGFGLLGTDQYGRDVFSQLVYGSRISLFVGLLSAFLSVTIGLFVGLLAGYLGKVADEIIMRINDGLLVLPGLPLLLVLIAVLGTSTFNLILLIGVLGWNGFARVVRSQVLSLKERPFVESARAVGAGKFYIILRHILPNVMGLVYVTLAFAVPGAILLEAAISWLGLYDPTVMSWGRMLHDVQNQPKGYEMWWWLIPPGLCIAAVSISFILLGYALDEILNPKLRVRR